MPIPDYQSMMLPTLQFVADGRAHKTEEVLDAMAERFKVTREERRIRSGSTNYLQANFSWTKTYLKKAGLIRYTGRSEFAITDLGNKVLAQKPTRIDKEFLGRFNEFGEWTNSWVWNTQDGRMEGGSHVTLPRSEIHTSEAQIAILRAPLEPGTHQEPSDKTPEETLRSSAMILKNVLIENLLDQVKTCSPQFFERLVIDLLLKMGYGGSFDDAGQAIGKSGDGGIDGIIKEDKLGLDVIYVQAKRWQSIVGAGQVRDFAGSLDYHGAKKGVFITTSNFSNDARNFVVRVGEKKIVLINGNELAQLMIDHDIGVATQATYVLKRIDTDYFEDQ